MIGSILFGIIIFVVLVFLFCLAFGIVVMAVSGAIFVVSELLVRLMKIGSKLRSWWAMKKWKRKFKKRFDDAPTADCYCIDCKHFKKGYIGHGDWDYCELYFWGTPDDGFCWRAVRKE